MAITQRTITPVNILSGAKRTSASVNIPNRIRGIKIQLTTASPNSWTDVTGQGRIVTWGVETREGLLPFEEWMPVNDIPFGTLSRGGTLPMMLMDNAQRLADVAGADARLFIITEGVTVRLGADISTSNVVGEIS